MGFWNLVFITLTTFSFFLPALFYYMFFIKTTTSTLNSLVLVFCSLAGTWFLFFLFYELSAWLKKDYYIAPISEKDYIELIRYKLIHYTNEDILIQNKDNFPFSYVNLKGRRSAKSNYNMMLRDKGQRFVWFHQEKTIGSEEPDSRSYLFSHGLERSPRKFKIIIDPSHLERENIYIRPNNKNIVYKGDVLAKAVIRTDFNCYEDKQYWGNINLIRFIFNFRFLHIAFHKTLGNILDKAVYFEKKKMFFYKAK